MSVLRSNSYLEEISRIDSERSPTRRRGYTFSVNESVSTRAGYTESAQQPTGNRCRSSTYAPGDDLPEYIGDDSAGRDKPVHVVMSGWLHKTTRLMTSKTRGHRHYRRFRLTAHSLEYSQLFQKVYHN